MGYTLTDINGIGPATADGLIANGYKTVRAVAKTSVSALSQVPGFSEARAQRTIAAAAALLPGGATQKKPVAPKADDIKEDKKGKKKDKKKKDKKSKKGKKKDKKKKKKGK